MIRSILFSGYSPIQKALMIFAFLVSAVFAICLHEYAHGYAAYKMGDPTAKVNGRLTINPIDHFEPFGIAMFLLVGFGFARPVPVDPRNFRNIRKGMLITAFAGVFANFLQVLLGFGMLIGFAFLLPVVWGKAFIGYLVLFFYYLALYMTLLNAVLIAFNLLPIYPLDGFRVVESLSRTNNAYLRIMRRWGSIILIGIVVLGYFFRLVGIPQADIFGQYLMIVQKGILSLAATIIGG